MDGEYTCPIFSPVKSNVSYRYLQDLMKGIDKVEEEIVETRLLSQQMICHAIFPHKKNFHA